MNRVFVNIEQHYDLQTSLVLFKSGVCAKPAREVCSGDQKWTRNPGPMCNMGPNMNYVVEYQPTSAQEFGVQLAVKSVV